MSKRRIDLTGKEFGNWRVILHDGPLRSGYKLLCECLLCGRTQRVDYNNLVGGYSKNCFICGRKAAWVTRKTNNPIIGKKYGNRTVTGMTENQYFIWSCGECGSSHTSRSMQSNTKWCRTCKAQHYGMQFTVNGESGTMQYWANKLGVTRQCIHQRFIKHGRSTEKMEKELVLRLAGTYSNGVHKPRRPTKDMTGKIIGTWKVVEYVGPNKYRLECMICKHTKRQDGTSLRRNGPRDVLKCKKCRMNARRMEYWYYTI
jgi:hypothetical protein